MMTKRVYSPPLLLLLLLPLPLLNPGSRIMVTAKKSVADAQLCFARPVRKSYLTKHYMPIPDSVYSKFSSGLLKGTLTLNGDWPVEVTEGSIRGGWEAFCKGNQIRENDTLVFRHGGGRNLSVEIYSNDGAGKDATPSTSKKRTRGKGVVEVSSDEEIPDSDDGGFGSTRKSLDNELVLASDTVVDVVKGIVAQLDGNSDVRFTVTKVPKVATPASAPASAKRKLRSSPAAPAAVEEAPAAPEPEDPPAAAVSPARGRKAAANTPKSGGRRASERKSAEPAKKKAKTPAAKKAPAPKEEKKPAAAGSPSSSKRGAAAAAGGRAKRKSSGKPAAEVIPDAEAAEEQKEEEPQKKAKKPKAEKPKKQAVKKTPKTPKSKGKRPKKAEEESSATRKARTFSSGYPNTMVVMKKSNLAPCFYLGIPSDFAKDHMPGHIMEFEMLDEDNRVWTVRWLGPPKMAFSGGWCYFAQDHHLGLGDACILEVMSPERVRISTFRASDKPPPATVISAVVAGSDNEAATGAATALTMTPTETKEVVVSKDEAEESKDMPVLEGVDVDRVVAVITDAATVAAAASPAENGVEEAAGEEEAEAEAEAEAEDDDEDYNPEEEEAKGK